MTRRRMIAGVWAGIIAACCASHSVDARPAFMRHGVGAPGVVAGEVTTFVVQNYEATSTAGFQRIGLPFKDGDVPEGSRIKIQRGGADIAAQFDQRSSYPSKSLRFCTACIRDTDFAGNESRTYSVLVEAGSWDNSSAATLANVTGVSDFNIVYSSMEGDLSGALPNHSASFNTHAGVPTRVTKYESGPVCDSWMIWGMAANGGTEHAHLKTIWYVSRWKNANGTQAAIEPTVVNSLDWWGISGKERLRYTATFRNGGATIETYGGSLNSSGVRNAVVEHPYQSQWATVMLNDNNQAGERFWVGAARPTLIYKPNQAYWISTDLVPPQNTSLSYTIHTDYTTGTAYGVRSPYIYQPCSGQGHRTVVTAPGGYPGRGVITAHEGWGFVMQTPLALRVMRLAAFAALHIPNHRRSEKLRTRPADLYPADGGAQDKANTLVPVILYDERGTSTPTSYYNFEADGMPAPAHAYANNISITDNYHDGWTVPNGGAANSAYSQTSLWSTNTGSSYTSVGGSTHSVAYSYVAYLHFAERFFLEALLDGGHDTVQAQRGLTNSHWYLDWRTSNTNTFYPGVPTYKYSGIAVTSLITSISTRTMGWASLLIGKMSVVPDNDVHVNYVKTFQATNAKWLADTASYIPASGKGQWNPALFGTAQWMESGIVTMGCYAAYNMTKDPNWKAVPEYTAKGIIHWADTNRLVGMGAAAIMTRASHRQVWSVSNDWLPDRWVVASATIVGATGVITMPFMVAGTGFYQAGDLIMLSEVQTNSVVYDPSWALPPELSLGTVYYIVNPSGNTFQIAATPGGSPITFAQNHTQSFGLRAAYMNNPLYVDQSADNQGRLIRSAAVMAFRAGHPQMTQEVMNKIDSFWDAPNYVYVTVNTSHPPWDLLASP